MDGLAPLRTSTHLMKAGSDSGSTSGSGATSGTDSSTGTSGTTSLIAEGQDRFLKLLVAQLQNQDPLSPMDNAQFTTQLAQISTVQGIEKLNSVMAQVLGAISAGQQMQAIGMIGRSALVEGGALALAEGAAKGGFKLDQAADSVKVSIIDDSGTLVRVLDLGKQNAGVATFDWDGKNAAGTAQKSGAYTFKVDATLESQPVTATAMTVSPITGATSGTEGVTLTVGGRSVKLSEVGQII